MNSLRWRAYPPTWLARSVVCTFCRSHAPSHSRCVAMSLRRKARRAQGPRDPIRGPKGPFRALWARLGRDRWVECGWLFRGEGYSEWKALLSGRLFRVEGRSEFGACNVGSFYIGEHCYGAHPQNGRCNTSETQLIPKVVQTDPGAPRGFVSTSTPKRWYLFV